MKEVVFTIGAPSRDGEECAEEIAKVFGECAFPLSVTVLNLMPREIFLPIGTVGFRLGHVADLSNREKKAVFSNVEQMRLLSIYVSAVAKVGQFKKAVRLTATVEESEEKSSAPAKRTYRRKTAAS